MSKKVSKKNKKVKLDDKPFKRMDRKAMRRAILAMRVSLLFIVASAVIIGLSLCEAVDATIIGQSGLAYDEYGDMVPVLEEEYFGFLDQRFSQGVFGRIGYYVSCFMSLLVHFFRIGWQPIPSYRVAISLMYLIVFIPLLVHWVRKFLAVRDDLSMKENRYQLEWTDQQILDRGGWTAGNAIFIGLTVLLMIGQFILPFSSFKMIPILILFLVFLVFEVIWWCFLRARFRLDRTEPKPKTRRSGRSKGKRSSRREQKEARARAEQIANSMIRR